MGVPRFKPIDFWEQWGYTHNLKAQYLVYSKELP
jgi:hypothetical protein